MSDEVQVTFGDGFVPLGKAFETKPARTFHILLKAVGDLSPSPDFLDFLVLGGLFIQSLQAPRQKVPDSLIHVLEHCQSHTHANAADTNIANINTFRSSTDNPGADNTSPTLEREFYKRASAHGVTVLAAVAKDLKSVNSLYQGLSDELRDLIFDIIKQISPHHDFYFVQGRATGGKSRSSSTTTFKRLYSRAERDEFKSQKPNDKLVDATEHDEIRGSERMVAAEHEELNRQKPKDKSVDTTEHDEIRGTKRTVEQAFSLGQINDTLLADTQELLGDPGMSRSLDLVY